MKKILVITAIATLLTSSTLFARNTCLTHEDCETNQVCECTIAADSAYDRFFYVDFHNIKKNHTYQCNILSTPVGITLKPDLSTFPAGATYQVNTEGLLMDTTQMTEEEGVALIKYFIPGSDYPSDTTAFCNEAS